MVEPAKMQTAGELEEPCPPRFWWLKRCLIAVAVLVLGLGLLHWAWGWYAERRIAQLMASCRERGEPTQVADFPEAIVPEAENAAPLLQKAAGLLTVSQTLLSAERNEEFRYLPFSAAAMKLLEADVQANAKVFAIVRQARSLPGAAWNPPLSTDMPAWRQAADVLYGAGRLADPLCHAAIHAHLHGDDAAAMEFIRDVLFIGQAIEQSNHPLSAGRAAECTESACTKLLEIAPAMQIQGQGPPAGPGRAVSGEQIRVIIALLLENEQVRSQRAIRAYQAWRALLFRKSSAAVEEDITEVLCGTGRPAPAALRGIVTAVVRPAMLLKLATVLQRFTDIISAQDPTPEWATILARLKPESLYQLRQPKPARRTGFFLVDLVYRNTYEARPLVVFVWPRYQIVKRRVAALKLAIRWYQLEHGGQLPPTLEALVPQYLAAVPLDPFAAKGQALRYGPSAQDPMRCSILYSVGINGIDDKPDERDWRVQSEAELYKQLDVIFPLGQRVRPGSSVSTTQATGNQDKVADNQVQAGKEEDGQKQPESGKQ
ncbi:MAG: hypothetical protein ACM359_01770 [Bacillota bacterium]